MKLVNLIAVGMLSLIGASAYGEGLSQGQNEERERLLARERQFFDAYKAYKNANKRPRKITAFTIESTKSINEYADKCLGEIIQIGNWNYPDEAKKAVIHGDVTVSFEVLPSGVVENIQVLKSSGHAILDAAIQRSVKFAEPFSAFPYDVRERASVVHIVKTFSFTRRN